LITKADPGEHHSRENEQGRAPIVFLSTSSLCQPPWTCPGVRTRTAIAAHLLRDPLIRLAMESDGVTEQEITLLWTTPSCPGSTRKLGCIIERTGTPCGQGIRVAMPNILVAL
jgi:hypothetical protein